ncbi:MAG: hypothetical protein WBE72_12650, partial [Terracidiphilus sp.]
ELRRGMGTTFKAELTFDPSDLGHINVLDQRKGNYIQVPALNQAYATRLSLWQHKVIRRYALERLNARTDTLALAQAKAEIRAFIDRDFHRKSTRGRKRHARFLSEPSPQLSTTETLENPGIRLVPPKDMPVVGATPNAIAPSYFQDDETLPVYEAGFDLPHPAPVIASAEKVAFAVEEA